MKSVKKYLALVLMLALAVFCGVVCGCKEKDGGVSPVVITATQEEDGKTLLDCMRAREERGEITFKISDGMITELNGTANGLKSYWMIYTDDAENANSSWGTLEYEGKTLGSAVKGAEELTVKAGCVYVWSYEIF